LFVKKFLVHSQIMYKLYYYPLNASMAPRFLLEKVSADYELILVDRHAAGQKAPNYLSLNPFGRIPTLIDGNLVLCESPAICLHLAEKHPNSNLMPTLASPERALLYQWMMYLTNTLQAELMVYSYPQRYVGDMVETSNILERVEQRIIKMLGMIDSQLKNHPFLAGNRVSVCDYFLFMLCVWADELKRPPLGFPHLSKLLIKMAALDEVVSVCRDENLNLDDYS